MESRKGIYFLETCKYSIYFILVIENFPKLTFNLRNLQLVYLRKLREKIIPIFYFKFQLFFFGDLKCNEVCNSLTLLLSTYLNLILKIICLLTV